MNRLSQFVDIAGRFARESKHDPFLVGCSIVLPTAAETSIRSRMKDIPKWKQATPDSLNLIVKIIAEHDIFGAIVKIEKSSPEWETFWAKGKQCYRDLANRRRGTATFLKPGNIFRQLVLSRCAIMAFVHYLESRGKPHILNSNGIAILNLRITCDTDIQCKDSVVAFKKTWCRWAKKSRLETTLGIKPSVDSIVFKTESEEPMLNLSDSLAGCVHASLTDNNYNVPAQLDRPSIVLLREFIESSDKLKTVSWPFKEIFPDITMG